MYLRIINQTLSVCTRVAFVLIFAAVMQLIDDYILGLPSLDSIRHYCETKNISFCETFLYLSECI